MITIERYYELVERCVEYDRAYHTEGISIVPNHIYDGIRRQIQEFEEANPDDISANSPTQRVGEFGVRDQLTVHHGSKMLSIKSYNTTKEITRIINEWYEMFGDRTVVVGEPKYDGNAGRVRYVDGVLEEAASRGDGDRGRDISSAIRRIVPESIEQAGTIDFIGEVTFFSKKFEQFNRWRVENGMEPVANERSAVSALLYGMKDFNDFPIEKYLVFVAFDVVSDMITFKSRSDDMAEFVKNHGLQPPNCYICRHKDVVDSLVNAVVRNYSSRYTEDNGLLLDGVVFKLDSLALCLTAGATRQHPKWAYAYKFEPIGTETTVWKIDHTVGRSGVVTPMIHVDPVKIGGVTVTKATLANASKMYRLDVRIGDKIHIYRAGDVIPQVGYVSERKKSAGPRIEWPVNCPCCGSVLETVGAKSFCRNADCQDRIIAQLTHFFGKTGVDLTGASEAVFERLVRFYGVKNALDVMNLTPAQIDADREGKLGNSARILLKKGIAGLKQRSVLLRKFIYALGIPGVGAATSTNLQCGLLSSASFLSLASVKELEKANISGVSKDTLKVVHDWLVENYEFVSALAAVIVPVYHAPSLKELVNSKISGQTFVFTGEMPQLRGVIEDTVKVFGGYIGKSVSKKTNALIVGDGASEKKVKAAAKYKVPTLTYADFQVLLGQVS